MRATPSHTRMMSFKLTKFLAGNHLIYGGVFQKRHIARFQQASEGTFESSIWISWRTFAAGNFSNAKRTQFIRIVTDRIVFVHQ